MKVILTFLLLIGFSFDVAHKCDNYFVGNVVFRRRGHAVDEDENAVIQGCKKGCFWNATYSDDGVPKCKKCSEIKDETKCLSHTTTCQWTKSKKCKSQSCPNISKSRITLNQAGDNSTKESQYRDRIKREKECVEGSPLEKKFNNLYWSDYSQTKNYGYAVWNLQDTCTGPGSTAKGTGPYGWRQTEVAADNKKLCEGFFGYYYTPNADNPANPANDACDENNCAGTKGTVTTPSHKNYEDACNAVKGCIYIKGTSDSGETDDVCEFAQTTSCTKSTDVNDRWVAGKNSSTECEQTKGCKYVRGAGGVITGEGRTDNRDKDGLTDTDKCVAWCDTFVAGTGTQKDCEVLGCTYVGGDTETSRPQRPGYNLKTFEDFDLCPPERHPPTRTAPGTGDQSCGINATLAVDYEDSEACDDRTYNDEDGDSFSCSIPALTTEESCKDGYGVWTAPASDQKKCRLLFSTVRSVCEFEWRDERKYVVYTNLSHHGGNLRPGTFHDDCVQKRYDLKDKYKTENVTGYDKEERVLYSYLSANDHERIYGYRPEEYCDHQLAVKLQSCQRTYDASVADCHTPVDNNKVTVEDWTRATTVDIKAARSACHRIYGCMYSKSNERCSVWAVWAFISTIVITVVVVAVGLGVGVVVLLTILGKSSA